MSREAWKTMPQLDESVLRQSASEMFGTYFVHRGMEEKFTYPEKQLLARIAGKFWQERQPNDRDAALITSARSTNVRDLFGREIKEPGLGQVVEVGRYSNLESWATVTINGAEGSQINDFYYLANISGLQSKDIARKRAQELKTHPLVRAVLVATNIDYQRGERPAKRADGVRELNLFEQVIKDLSGDFQSIITLEAHSPGTAFKCFESDMPILDLTTMPLLVEAADKLRMLGEELVVAVGDEGALEMGVMVQELLTDKKGKEIEIVPGFKQKINNKTQVVFLENDLQKVAGKVVVITEDIVDSGGTMLNTIARLKEGGAKKIIILAPHAVLSTPEGKEGAERLGKQEDVILIMTDSVRGELPEKVAATQKTRQSIYLVDIVDPLLEVVDLDRKGVLRDVYQNKDLRLAHLLLLGFDIAAWANEKYVKVAEKLAEERREAMGIEFEKMGVA